MQIHELDEVCFVAGVKCGGEQTTRVKIGTGGSWTSASLDGGIVTVKHKNGGVSYVPLTNVAYLTPKAAETKAKK